MTKSAKDFFFGKGRAAGIKSARFQADNHSVLIAYDAACSKVGYEAASMQHEKQSFDNFTRGYEAGIALNVADRDRRIALKAPKLTPKERYKKKLEQRHSRKLEKERGLNQHKK